MTSLPLDEKWELFSIHYSQLDQYPGKCYSEDPGILLRTQSHHPSEVDVQI